MADAIELEDTDDEGAAPVAEYAGIRKKPWLTGLPASSTLSVKDASESWFIYPDPETMRGQIRAAGPIRLRTIRVTRGDCEFLRTGEYFNDTAIDWWSELIFCRCIDSDACRERIHFFSSFFYRKLSTPETAVETSAAITGLPTTIDDMLLPVNVIHTGLDSWDDMLLPEEVFREKRKKTSL